MRTVLVLQLVCMSVSYPRKRYYRHEKIAQNWTRPNLHAPIPKAKHKLELEHKLGRNATRRLTVPPPVAKDGAEAPLFMGIGTHYANVYVGTPPQRVSVIVDTGSHHTAFPCSGCKSCGHHTDPYFDPEKSKSLKYLGCHECIAAAHCVTHKCQVSQSYTEGSSWKAYQMRDIYYVGGEVLSQKHWISTNFVFGCQTYETGLFRTQKADGIMGMSMHSQTLVPTMRAAGQIDHNAFSMCFMYGGGTLTLGGVDTSLHESQMQFTPLAKNSGWFTVRLLDILVNGVSIGVPASIYATGKGTIVDSGTTDTYLPRRAADKFKAAWARELGPGAPKYSNTKVNYTPDQIKRFPLLTFILDNGVRVDVKPSAYMEQAAGKYIPRVYLSEASGTVLGANFMQDHDIFFDAENRRLGFAKAHCSYASSLSALQKVDPTLRLLDSPSNTKKLYYNSSSSSTAVAPSMNISM